MTDYYLLKSGDLVKRFYPSGPAGPNWWGERVEGKGRLEFTQKDIIAQNTSLAALAQIKANMQQGMAYKSPTSPTPTTSEQIYSQIYQQSKAQHLWTPQEKSVVQAALSTAQSTAEGIKFQSPLPPEAQRAQVFQSQLAQETAKPTTKSFGEVAPYKPQDFLAGLKFQTEKLHQHQETNPLLYAGTGLVAGAARVPSGLVETGKSLVSDPIGTILNIPAGFKELGYELRTDPSKTVGEFAFWTGASKLLGRAATAVKRAKTPVKVGEFSKPEILIEDAGKGLGRTTFAAKIGKQKVAGAIRSEFVIDDTIFGGHVLGIKTKPGAKTILGAAKTRTFVKETPLADQHLTFGIAKQVGKKEQAFVQRSFAKLLWEEPEKIGLYRKAALVSQKYKGSKTYSGFGLSVGTEKMVGAQKFIGDIRYATSESPIKAMIGEPKTPFKAFNMPKPIKKKFVPYADTFDLRTILLEKKPITPKTEGELMSQLIGGRQVLRPMIKSGLKKTIKVKSKPVYLPRSNVYPGLKQDGWASLQGRFSTPKRVPRELMTSGEMQRLIGTSRTGSRLRSRGRTTIRTREDALMRQMLGTQPSTRSRSVNKIMPVFGFGFRYRQAQRQQQRQRTPLSYGTRASLMPTVPMAFPVFRGWTFALPKLPKNERKKKVNMGNLLGLSWTKYKPSLTALEFGIKAKRPPKSLTGLEIRPIVNIKELL